jgi:murein DD-endopeptidase MepM/ murein hydrolase activator NlpD
MRRIALGLIATLALASCASVEESVLSRQSQPRAVEPRPALTPNIYMSAPRAPLHSELFACNTWGSNLGLIGQRGEAANYTPYMETPAGSLLRNPTESACMSSGYGWRGVANGGGRQHNGLDLANPNGGYIYDAGDGRIVSADWRGGFGNFIEIDHGNGVRTRYAHMAEIDPNLRPGDRITAGTPIGRMGMTGNATGVHLHYEVLVDGLLVDPLNYGLPPQYQTTPVTQSFDEPIAMETLPDPEPVQ